MFFLDVLYSLLSDVLRAISDWPLLLFISIASIVQSLASTTVAVEKDRKKRSKKL